MERAAKASLPRRRRSGAAPGLPKPCVLFVDDEQRVLNSMRALFRRDYEVHLATRGAEALKILGNHSIDVIVADQRMPEMSGVEVLGAGKDISPRTVRILLTGYADLDAVEGSINIGEVFRFLSKPCPPSHLKETLKLAVEVAKSTAAVANDAAAQTSANGELAANDEELIVPLDELDDDHHTATTINQSVTIRPPVDDTQPIEIVLSGDDSMIIDAAGGRTGRFGRVCDEVSSVGVAIFTTSDSFATAASSMLKDDYPVFPARTLVQVTEILAEGRAGVLVTDFVADGRVLRKMISTLKRYLPELITIVVSNDRDASEMISLINHGQVFRYMSKPAQRDRFMQNVNAAVLKHLQLRNHPELALRYQVEDDGSDTPALFTQFLGRIKGMRRLFARG